MAQNDNVWNVVGSWSFLIGVVIAVILGIFGVLNSTWVAVLVVIGLIIGLLNVADSESEPFLLSGIALIIASSLGQTVVASIPIFLRVLQSLLVIFVPATIIVALRNVFTIARRY